MSDRLRAIYEEISGTESLDEYQELLAKCIQALSEEGYGETAAHIKALVLVRENRFSKRAAKEELEYGRKRVQGYLSEILKQDSHGQAMELVKEILRNFHHYCRYLYKEPVHEKCGSCLKTHLPGLKIENEYDIQRLLYPVLFAVFGEARLEETQDTGHHMVRKDITLDVQDIVIELKCSRSSMTERQLSEEVAADIIHYENRGIFFYIYDKGNIIKNPLNFKRTYEEKRVDDKEICIFILQPNLL